MIDLYYWTTPNGHKLTIGLEEMGLEYKIKPVDINVGDQFHPDFLAISPNNRIPAIVDHAPADGGAPMSSNRPLCPQKLPTLFISTGAAASSTSLPPQPHST